VIHLRNKFLCIGFVGSISHPFFNRVHRGLRNYCAATDDVEMVRFSASTRLTPGALDFVDIDGVVAVSPMAPVILSHSGHMLPTVNVSNAEETPLQTSVTNDDEAIGRLAAQSLRRGAVRHLACLANDKPWLNLARMRGFIHAAREAEMPNSAHVMQHKEAHQHEDLRTYFQSFADQILHFCAKLPRPFGLFCTTDDLAAQVLDVLLRADYSIPRDVLLIGCDNNSLIRQDTFIPLSSIEPNAAAIGWCAGETLARKIRGEKVPRHQKLPPLGVMERQSTGVPEVSRRVRRAVQHMRRNIRTETNMDELARSVGVSRRTLETSFRREMGYSPYDYLIRLRLERARYLLTDSDMRIGEIAEESGFGDIRTLGTWFRRNLGLSPRQWRAMHRA